MYNNKLKADVMRMYMQGYKLKEIAEALGVTNTNVQCYTRNFRKDERVYAIRVKNQQIKDADRENINVTVPDEAYNPPPKTTSESAKKPPKKHWERNVKVMSGRKKDSKYIKYLPEDIKSIIGGIADMDILDVLYANIMIQFATILHGQTVMFVKDKDDTTVLTTSETNGEKIQSYNNTVEFSFNKMANFLNAQSKAMITLVNLIHEYTEELRYCSAIEVAKHETQLATLKAKLKLLENNATETDGHDEKIVQLIESIDFIAKEQDDGTNE